MTVATDRRMTLKEYLDYDDGTDTRSELVDGVLVEMGAESPTNVVIGAFLASFFGQFLPFYLLHRGTEVQTLGGVMTSRYPDFLVLTEDGWDALEGQSRSLVTYDMPSPVLVVEVVSPGNEDSENYIRDYKEKPVEYADRRIPEFWQIDPSRSWVRVGILTDARYQFTTFRGETPIVSQVFPEIEVTAARLLSPVSKQRN